MATKPKPTAATAKPNPTVSEELIEQGKQAVVKRKRNRPDLANYGYENAKPGDNAASLRHAMASLALPKIDTSDPAQVEQRINDYFEYCIANDRKPSMIGIANWVGVDATTINSWEREEYRTLTHSPIIKRAKAIMHEQWVDYMQNGKINPASGIFLGKNMFGYKDTQDVVVTPKNPLGDSPDEKLLESRIADIPIEDVTTLD